MTITALPTPFYDEGGITIYNAPCEEVLPHLDGVGLVLTSPPYNLSEDGHRPRGTAWSQLDGGYSTYTDDLPRPDYVAWQRKVLEACWGTLTDEGAIFYQHKPIARGNVARLPTECLPPHLPLRQILVWDRCSGIQRTHWHYVPSYEWVMILAKEGFRINTLDVSDVWRIPIEHGSPHPAPFPLKLARKAIATTDAALILDPFMGSGTTLRAAYDLNRRAIGIEVDAGYCQLAVDRLAQGAFPI